MEPVAQTSDRAEELLAEAVATVTRRALRPELKPFGDQLTAAAGGLEKRAGELDLASAELQKVVIELRTAVTGLETWAAAQATRLESIEAGFKSLSENADALAERLTEVASTGRPRRLRSLVLVCLGFSLAGAVAVAALLVTG